MNSLGTLIEGNSAKQAIRSIDAAIFVPAALGVSWSRDQTR